MSALPPLDGVTVSCDEHGPRSVALTYPEGQVEVVLNHEQSKRLQAVRESGAGLTAWITAARAIALETMEAPA